MKVELTMAKSIDNHRAKKNPRASVAEPTKFRIIAKFFLFRKTQQKWQRFSTTYQEHLASFC